MAHKALAVRFAEKVRISDGCWEWTGDKDVKGYGRFFLRGEVIRAHRVSQEIYAGPIPDGMYVLHRCDNPGCVNPAHLFLGTQTDNMLDMEAKGRGRHPRGEGHLSSKLTEVEVRKIISDGRSLSVIAKDYDVGKPLVWKIKKRLLWRHLCL